jgi:hypothetical protein
MSSYHFPADAGRQLPENATGAEAIVALLDRLGMPHENITINRKGDTVTVEGHVPDGAAEERLVLAVGNIKGVSWVQDRLTRDTPACSTPSAPSPTCRPALPVPNPR